MITDDSWWEEHNFWYTKFSRAAIRRRAAVESYDQEKIDIAIKQMKLYRARMNAVVPEHIKEEWRQNSEEEKRAAFNEMSS